MPRADGTLPPNWPVGGFRRPALFRGPIALVDTLLNDYGLPFGQNAGAVQERRDALALHIGTMRS